MKLNKFALLTAAAVGALGSAAQAQLLPAAEIHGAGASLPQNIIRQSADCFGLKQSLGFGVSSPTAAPATNTLFDFNFNTAAVDALGNRFDCAANSANAPIILTPAGGPQFSVGRIVQPDISVFYLSTGSGQGVTAFLNGRVSSTINVSAGFSAYDSADGYQYSASETALSSGNITTYNTASINPFGRYTAADTAANLFGPAIQIPFVIAPVAIAYMPVYAKERNNNVAFINSYRFTLPAAAARADGSGGLRLTRAQYCGIFNGTITNWNQLPTSVVNKDVNDPAPFNVPMFLVGRSETSGTTSLFTRAIAAQCNGLSVNTGIGGTLPSTPIVNKFGNSENRLPYDGVTTVANTAYTGAAGAVSPTNSLSGAFFNKTTLTLTGTPQAGFFTVANGNDGVADATAFHLDPGSVAGTRTTNGQVAYISAEQTLPATLFNGSNGYGLNTASLQVNGTGTVYAAPDAVQAQAAFAGTQPPQSKGTAGAYCDTPTGCTPGNRANPLDWVAPALASSPQAAPIKGYPIIGTSNVLTYTCFATPERRRAIDSYFATVVGKTLKDHNAQTMPSKLVNDAVNGVFARNGLAPLPGAWANAVTETFLRSSAQLGTPSVPASRLGLRNLWIQDKLAAGTLAVPTVTVGNVAVCGDNPATPAIEPVKPGA